jgi:SAM-dependent methyltransferase
MQRCADLLRVRADDAEYRRLAAAEADFWRRPHPYDCETLGNDTREGQVDRYINERFTGDQRVRWHDTIARCQTFRRGIMLGTTALRLEANILKTNPALHLTFVDLSEALLRRRSDVLGQRFPGRVATCTADLNFIELPADAYDLVVSASTLHHVTNLEYLAYQINRTLTADGWFFLYDYVGERRCTPSPAKKQVFEVIYGRDLQRQPGRQPGLVWSDDSDLSPFCAVRSPDILAAVRTQLHEVEVHTAGSLIVPLMRSRPADQDAALSQRMSRWRIWFARLQGRLAWRRPDMLGREFCSELCTVGDIMSEAGLLEPGIAFAIYRKRAERAQS